MNRYRLAVVVAEKILRDRLCHCLEFIGEKVEVLVGNESSLTGKRVLNERRIILISDTLAAAEISPHLPLIGFGQGEGPNLVAHLELPIQINSVVAALYAARAFIDQQNYDWPLAEKESLLFPRLRGFSREIQTLRELMGKAAQKDVTVLVSGESGAGKEIVARSLHAASARSEGPFVPVKCGAIQKDLIDSELFGHERGAFTGAVSTRAGRFELADGGTIFLDEVGELPHLMQAKLLRVIQERCFERLGGTETHVTDVRIIAATRSNLHEMIRQGSFREDLYYCLNVFPIRIPPLRKRAQDIPVLIHALLRRTQATRAVYLQFTPQALIALSEYDWPGNVRELANLVERLTIQHPDSIVGVSELPGKYRSSAVRSSLGASELSLSSSAMPHRMGTDDTTPLLPLNGINLKEHLSDLEKNLIQQALDDTNSVVARAADRLNIRRTTLVEKMRKYGLARSVQTQGQQ